MNEKDLDDLAMIAVCHHRLFLRACQAGNHAASQTIVSESSDSMPVLCKAVGIADALVMERATAILDASRAPQPHPVH